MINKKIIFAVLIILGVVFAFYLIGDVALAGLLGLFGLRGEKDKTGMTKLVTEADEHEDMANHLIGEAVMKQDHVADLDEEIETVLNQKADNTKQIDDVLAHAKKDWR